MNEDAEKIIQALREMSEKADTVIKHLDRQVTLLININSLLDSIDDSTWRAPR
jgi:hypothetical protein